LIYHFNTNAFVMRFFNLVPLARKVSIIKFYIISNIDYEIVKIN